MTHTTDPAARAARAAHDQRIYDLIVRGEQAQPGTEPRLPSPIGRPIGADRARQLAARSSGGPRRPPLTSARVRQLSALADLVRPRARSTSTLYGLPRDAAADIRRAIAFIDDLAAWERRTR